MWGAGKNGKDMAKHLLANNDTFYWVCDNEKKIGKDIYNVRMQHYNDVKDLDNPQIIVVTASPDGKKEVKELLNSWNKQPVEDYWFFL